MRNESRKILGLPELKSRDLRSGTGDHDPSRSRSTPNSPGPVDADEARSPLVNAPGVVVVDDPAALEFPTPADVVGTDPTYVGRIRRAVDEPNALDMFMCGDNLRKGAALNTAQIAELLAAEFSQPRPV